MTEQEFTEFMLACCLSNEEIAELWGFTTHIVRDWRNGKRVPLTEWLRQQMVWITAMEENRVLRAMIAKRQEGQK